VVVKGSDNGDGIRFFSLTNGSGNILSEKKTKIVYLGL